VGDLITKRPAFVPQARDYGAAGRVGDEVEGRASELLYEVDLETSELGQPA
jgi:hypothetical protein